MRVNLPGGNHSEAVALVIKRAEERITHNVIPVGVAHQNVGAAPALPKFPRHQVVAQHPNAGAAIQK